MRDRAAHHQRRESQLEHKYSTFRQQTMEEEKVMHQRPSRWQFLAGSTFLLCLLLVGTVGTLIYVQLSSGACVSRAQRSGSADIQETIHLVGTDKMPLGDETISYNKEESIAVYVGAGGSFNLQDYGKGIHITKIQGTGKCVVAVTDSTAITSRGMEDFLQGRDGRNVNMTIDYDANYQTIPGMIEDTSFISPRADEYCTEGYQWQVEHPKPSTRLPGQPDNGDGAVVSGEEDHVIVKRGQPGSSCHCHCHGDHCHCHCGCGCGGGGQPGAAGQP